MKENDGCLSATGRFFSETHKIKTFLFFTLVLMVAAFYSACWSYTQVDPGSGNIIDTDHLSCMGWPSYPDEEDEGLLSFKNIYAGLMLGIVFGFLDNAGLFVAGQILEDAFRAFARKVTAFVLLKTKEGELERVSGKMLEGLGNTFSDVVGVLLGSAVLQGAKAGLGVDPTFWLGDVFSMFVGCLMGVVLVSVIANSKICSRYLVVLAITACVSLFAAIVLASIKAKGETTANSLFYASVSCTSASFIITIGFLIGGVATKAPPEQAKEDCVNYYRTTLNFINWDCPDEKNANPNTSPPKDPTSTPTPTKSKYAYIPKGRAGYRVLDSSRV